MKKIALFVFLVFGSLWAEATELVNLITTYQADRGALSRLYTNRLSAEYFARMESFNQDYLKTLRAQNYDALSEDGKIDYVLFRNYLEKQLAELDLDFGRLAVAPQRHINCGIRGKGCDAAGKFTRVLDRVAIAPHLPACLPVIS